MKAIDKAMNNEARNRSINWTNCLMGQCRVTIDPSEFGVKIETFRKQARLEGFRTALWGDEVQLYR